MDKRALKILLNTYWTAAGWKPAKQRNSPPEDFIYAKSKGLMFDPVTLDHTQALNRLSTCIKRLNRRIVANGFLASLSTRRLDWRSALGSYAVFQHMADHEPIGNEIRCNVCGHYLKDPVQDLNVLNFERLKWGGIRHDHVVYAALDLRLFLEELPPSPNDEDIQIFRNIVSSITKSQHVGSAGLHAHFAKDLKSNKAERDVLIAILGFCGILGTVEHPGYTERFVPATERDLPDRHFVDMPYPACWWRSDIGINQPNLNEYFGHVL